MDSKEEAMEKEDAGLALESWGGERNRLRGDLSSGNETGK